MPSKFSYSPCQLNSNFSHTVPYLRMWSSIGYLKVLSMSLLGGILYIVCAQHVRKSVKCFSLTR